MKRLLVIFLCIMAIQGVAQKPWNVKNIEDAFGKKYYLTWLNLNEYQELKDNVLVYYNGEYKKIKKIDGFNTYLCDTYLISGVLKIGKKEYVRFVNDKVDICIPLKYCQENICYRLISKDYWDKEFKSYAEKYAYVDKEKFYKNSTKYWDLRKIIEYNYDVVKVDYRDYIPIKWQNFRYEFKGGDNPIIIYLGIEDYIGGGEKKLTYYDLQAVFASDAIISKATFDSLVNVQNAIQTKQRIEKERQDSIAQREKFVKDSIKLEYANMREKCEKVLSKKYPLGVARILDFDQNSVGGVNPTIEWICYDANVKIKYIEFSIKAYNKVDDVIYCCHPSTNATYKFAVGESSYYSGRGECTYYCDNVYRVILQYCKVQTYDGKWHKIPINTNAEEELRAYIEQQLSDRNHQEKAEGNDK